METKLAFLEDFLYRLQQEVVERNGTIDRLVAEHGAMKERLLQITREIGEIPDRKPPHY